jgi:hypothetical protein
MTPVNVAGPRADKDRKTWPRKPACYRVLERLVRPGGSVL